MIALVVHKQLTCFTKTVIFTNVTQDGRDIYTRDARDAHSSSRLSWI